MNIFFFLTLFVASLSAEKLLFQEGQQAHYTVSQSVDVKDKALWLEDIYQIDSRAVLDLELVKVPEGEADFPFIINVLVTEIDFTFRSEDADTEETIEMLESSRNALVGKTLQFQVNGSFDVEELSGALKELGNDFIPLDISFGNFFFKFFLTQLFDRGNVIDLTPVLSFESDSAIVGGAPAICVWDEEKMSSNWEATLRAVENEESVFCVKEAAKLAVESTTLIERPLVQERSCNYSYVSYSILHNIKFVGTQRWESF